MCAAAPLALASFTLVSCLTPFDLAANAGLGVAQAGTSSFIQGSLQAAFNKPMDRVLEAATRAMERLGYPTTREDSGTHYAQLQSLQADGSSIVIKLKKSSETVTGLSIRVGLWGDSAVSRLILLEIEKELNALPEAVPGSVVPPAANEAPLETKAGDP